MTNLIEYAVVPVAGLGTRLLPASKVIPKEMFPLPVYTQRRIVLYPMIQIIYEELFRLGVRKFCFVIGPEKQSIRKYFNPDYAYIKMLKEIGKNKEARELDRFYKEVEDSQIVFAEQEKALGVGDAVLRCKKYVDNNDFFLNMGDDIILNNSRYNQYKELINLFYKENADACAFIMKVENPMHYGIVEGKFINQKVVKIDKIIEKPNKPTSNLAIISTYIFKSHIFDKLKELKDNKFNWELPDAVQELIKEKGRVFGYLLNEKTKRIDIGRPESYINVFTDFVNHLRIYK